MEARGWGGRVERLDMLMSHRTDAPTPKVTIIMLTAYAEVYR